MNQPKLLDPRIEAARKHYLSLDGIAYDQNVAIDDNATIREADGGHWIAAWLWLPDEEQS